VTSSEGGGGGGDFSRTDLFDLRLAPKMLFMRVPVRRSVDFVYLELSLSRLRRRKSVRKEYSSEGIGRDMPRSVPPDDG